MKPTCSKRLAGLFPSWFSTSQSEPIYITLTKCFSIICYGGEFSFLKLAGNLFSYLWCIRTQNRPLMFKTNLGKVFLITLICMTYQTTKIRFKFHLWQKKTHIAFYIFFTIKTPNKFSTIWYCSLPIDKPLATVWPSVSSTPKLCLIGVMREWCSLQQ